MKNNSMLVVLVGVLLLSSIVTATFSALYVFRAREMRRLQVLQMQAASINNNSALIRSLAGELIEYSKRNPAIDPLLEKFEIKPKPGAPANPSGK